MVEGDHRERMFQMDEDPERKRVRSYASVAEVSCANDLLLLKVIFFAFFCVCVLNGS